MKIAVCGDSFAANNFDPHSWVNLLSREYEVQHLAQAGISEYKIYKQILSVDADFVIVCHTSPYRVHTNTHPWHQSGFHQHSDLIFSDIEDKYNQTDNEKIKTAYNYFQFYFDPEYYENIYRLVRKDINQLMTIPSLHIDNFEISKNFAVEDCKLDLSNVWRTHPGIINHYSIEGNLVVYSSIKDMMNRIANDNM